MTIEKANKYFAFGNHAKSGIWNRFAQANREGAVESAKRILSRGLRRALNESEAEYKQGDTNRDDFAVFEQALYLLEGGQIADAGAGDAMAVLTGKADEAETTRQELYAPEALRWLGGGGGQIVRG